jgi:hypothetical protein
MNEVNSVIDNKEMLESQEFRDWMESLLKEEYPITVTFVKSDGTDRTMRCTKHLGSIPEEKHPSGNKQIKEGTAIRVFDLDKQEWRSFKPSSIKQIQFTLE